MTKLVSNNNANNNDYDEILETCLDAVVRGQATVEACVQQFPEFKELGELLKTAIALHEMPHPVMADAFTAQTQRQLQDQLRARVRAHAARAARSDSARQSVPAAAPRWTWRRLLLRLGTAAFLLTVLTVSGVGLIRASENAVPRDPLYWLKRFVESVDLTFSSEQTRPTVLVRIAEARVQEIAKLTPDKRVTEGDLREMSESVNLAILSQKDSVQRVRLHKQAVDVVNNARASGAVTTAQAAGALGQLIIDSASAATATAIVQTSSTAVRTPTQAPTQTPTVIPAQTVSAPSNTTIPTQQSNPTSSVVLPPAPTNTPTTIGNPVSSPPPLPTAVTTAQISTNVPPTQSAVTSAATVAATLAPTDIAGTQQTTQEATSATLPATPPATNPATDVATPPATVPATSATLPATLEATPEVTIQATAVTTSVATEAPTVDTTAQVTVVATGSATEAPLPTAVSELPTSISAATEAAIEPATAAFTATRTPTKMRTPTRTRTSTRTPTSTPPPTLTPLPTSTPVPTFTPIPDIPGLPPTSLKQQPQTGVFNGCAPEGTGGDPVANVLRNRTDEGNFQPVPFEVLLGAPWPQEAAKKPHAEWPQSARDLADRVEALPVMIEGYIAQVQPKGPEPANCNSGSDVNYQIWLVAAPEARGDFTGSIIMQITPRVRANRPGWSIEKLVTLATAGTRVRLSGWVVLDADHPEDVRKTRGTLWEIHPVMQFAVAKDGQWIRLEDYQP